MSLDVQAIRAELVADPPTGFAGYSHLPGTAQLPAVLAGLPDEMVMVSDGVWRIDLPLVVIVPAVYTPESETQLLAACVTVAAAYTARRGTAFSSCSWTSIDQFNQVSVGTVAAMAAHLNLQILARSNPNV